MSIKSLLSLGFFLFLFLVIFLGVFNITCLTDFNDVANQISNRWLPSTRFLGDLNNYTSDFRAAEGTLLLSANPSDIAASEREMHELDENIVKARNGYEQISHDHKEADLYMRFVQDWKAYRKIADDVLALMYQGKKEEGIRIYKTTSNVAYNAASDTLGLLTNLNVIEGKDRSDRAASTYGRVRVLSLFAMLTAILMVIVGILYIRRRISTPMLEMADSMHLLAENDMEVHIKGAERHDEIGEMARALTVFRNNSIDLITSRKGLVQQASMLEEKLEHERGLMDAQRNFISTASHEFRTPLNIIDGHAQRLLKTQENADSQTIADRATKIRNAVRQMTALIDNLINAARLFDGGPALYFHPVEINIKALLREICNQHREIASGTQIVEKLGSHPLHISGDPKLLQQLLGNLLSNAIKYSPHSSRIEVGAVRQAKHIAVTVSDHGVGIPQKDIGTIFERYSRGSNVTDISGTGIGLYLAKMIAELHGGSILVESIEGKGTVFTVQLPALGNIPTV